MKESYKIVFTDYYFPNLKKEKKQLEKLGKLEIIDCNNLVEGEVASEDQLIEYLKKNNALDADAVFVNHAHLTEKYISQLTNCKGILRYGIGIDNIDDKFA
jgi:D-3-phosphoglycerate dehydrogenase / 2-oxoglutarate reductase